MAMVPYLHQGNIYTKWKLWVWRDQECISLVGAITSLNCAGRLNTPSRGRQYSDLFVLCPSLLLISRLTVMNGKVQLKKTLNAWWWVRVISSKQKIIIFSNTYMVLMNWQRICKTCSTLCTQRDYITIVVITLVFNENNFANCFGVGIACGKLCVEMPCGSTGTCLSLNMVQWRSKHCSAELPLANTHCGNVLSIHEFTQCVWTLLILCCSTSNTVMYWNMQWSISTWDCYIYSFLFLTLR